MKIAATYSYRHALAILEKECPRELKEVLQTLKSVDFVPLIENKSRARGGKIVMVKSISPAKTNTALYQALRTVTPKIISESESNLAADAKKGKIQIEIQFGNMAR